jgi:hypothetical protein
MPWLNRILRLANSPQGRRALAQAKAYAQSPEGRARIDQVRREVAARRARKRPR